MFVCLFRYFALEGGYLKYYESDKKATMKGALELERLVECKVSELTLELKMRTDPTKKAPTSPSDGDRDESPHTGSYCLRAVSYESSSCLPSSLPLCYFDFLKENAGEAKRWKDTLLATKARIDRELQAEEMQTMDEASKQDQADDASKQEAQASASVSVSEGPISQGSAIWVVQYINSSGKLDIKNESTGDKRYGIGEEDLEEEKQVEQTQTQAQTQIGAQTEVSAQAQQDEAAQHELQHKQKEQQQAQAGAATAGASANEEGVEFHQAQVSKCGQHSTEVLTKWRFKVLVNTEQQ